MKPYFLKSLAILLICPVFLFSGCSKENDGDPPEIPPKESFIIDFSDFESNNFKTAAINNNDYSNYQRAAASVFVWNLVISVHLAIPVATFVNSFNFTPEYLPDEEAWLWAYDVDVANGTYTANLYGKIFDTYVQWDMYISKTGLGAFEDFHWYSGTSNLDNTGGEWTLLQNPENPDPFVGIVWNRNISEGTHDITYTNIVPEGPENGGYISHGFTNDEKYNAFYDIYMKGVDNLVEINLHRTTQEGRIKDPAFFGDDNFYCWDSEFFNTECDID